MTRPIQTHAAVGPRRRRRPSWAELEQRRRHQRFHRLLDRSFGFRLLMATVASGLLLGGVNRWEQCRTHGFASGCLLRDPGGIVNISNVEALSIVTAAFVYLLEGGKRRQREHLDAMEVILNCQQAGARLSHARNGALEQLSESGLWLDGLDLSGTQLNGLQVPHARWRQMNLSNTSLQRACLADADLQQSDLSNADLSDANLQHADLRTTTLRGTNLSGADLSHADLRGADTTGCLLAGAILRGADLRGTPLATTADPPA